MSLRGAAVPFKGTEIRAVDHPEKGMLLMATDLLVLLGYAARHVGAAPFLKEHGVAQEERVAITSKSLATGYGPKFGVGRATFLTRAGVHQLLMASTKPAAKEFREWLDGEVVVAMGAFSAGGPRILDTDLAANLGMAKPENIRTHVIRPNMQELEAFGIISRGETNTGKRGRPGTAFYLNEEQALLVCLLSRTERAKAVRAEVIRVFTAYRRGDLVAASVRLRLSHSPAKCGRLTQANGFYFCDGARRAGRNKELTRLNFSLGDKRLPFHQLNRIDDEADD